MSNQFKNLRNATLEVYLNSLTEGFNTSSVPCEITDYAREIGFPPEEAKRQYISWKKRGLSATNIKALLKKSADEMKKKNEEANASYKNKAYANSEVIKEASNTSQHTPTDLYKKASKAGFSNYSALTDILFKETYKKLGDEELARRACDKFFSSIPGLNLGKAQLEKISKALM